MVSGVSVDAEGSEGVRVWRKGQEGRVGEGGRHVSAWRVCEGVMQRVKVEGRKWEVVMMWVCVQVWYA